MKARRNLWPFSSRATRPRQTMPASSRSASRHETPAARGVAFQYKGYRVYPSGEGWRTSLGQGDSLFDSDTDVKRFIDSWNRKNPAKQFRTQREAERFAGGLRRKGIDPKIGESFPRDRKKPWVVKWQHNPGKGAFQRCVEAVSAKGSAYDPWAVCAAAGRKKYGTKKFAAMAKAGRKKKRGRNPADEAAQMSERFHGRPVTEVLDVEEEVHYHEHLAELGELERLKVKALDGGIVTLTGFDGALLCSNEEGSQLYIRGGDQAVDLAEFAVQKPYHDKEDLGEVVKIWYFTTKEHLGSEGGTASYHHEFGEEDRERGMRPRRPRLEYSTRDQRLSFVGGAYTVEPEGIKN